MEVNIIKDVLDEDKAYTVDFYGDILRGSKKITTRFTATAEVDDSIIKDSITEVDIIKDSLKGF